MHNMGEWERKNLVTQLMQGRELTKQLQAHFRHASSSSSSSSSSSTSHEMQELLIFRILVSYDKALSMLNWNYAMGEPATTGSGGGLGQSRKSESPPSPGESPMSRDMDRDNREHEGNNNNDDNGDSRSNRKVMPRWTKCARVTQGTLIEGQLDDGLRWRKYGQKDILGAKFPRGYYRCTHKGTQGCLATKLVQQSDEDPTVFEITYRGKHTCSNPFVGTNPPSRSPENMETNDALVVAAPPSEQPQPQPQHQQLNDYNDLLDFYPSLTMITDSLSKNPPSPVDRPSIAGNSHQFHPPLEMFDFTESLTGFDLVRESQNFRSPDHSELGLVVLAANHTATSSGINSRAVDIWGNLEFACGLTELDNNLSNAGFFSK